MSNGQLTCRFCGDRHKADSRKFPLVLYGDQDIIDKETRQIVGRKKVIIGYVCRKCKGKYDRHRQQQQQQQQVARRKDG